MPDEDIANNAKALACQQCEKRFTRPENLARHMKTRESCPVSSTSHNLREAGKVGGSSRIKLAFSGLLKFDISANFEPHVIIADTDCGY
ncbi:uncharacterized protein M421DRAFT_186307 [Didymella exigua CBS 183.55]|uniref:C2H2-type domain-containing protein n=1 Tax=Didymella exigua CBS 183.55 TaxID=1150837 RepID=A0A6A5RIH2_9PLEO|nr:uncharacterized protein M421DRAFT_186307 [Didymella exigua CBS 183.55]KAF1926888.1 hypothetical protein M421DRAFT_186307 [Didymella exigua CBS 183.55]